MTVEPVFADATPEPPLDCSASEFMAWAGRPRLLVGVVLDGDDSGADIGDRYLDEVTC